MPAGNATGIWRLLLRFNRGCATLAGLVLLFITGAIFVDVFLRYFFDRPSIWVTEVTTYLYLYIIFLGGAYALQNDMHIRVGFLADRLPPAAARWLRLVVMIMAMIFCLGLLWQTSVMTWDAFRENWTSPTILHAPYAYIYAVMVLGSLSLFLTMLVQTILEFSGGLPGPTEEKR